MAKFKISLLTTESNETTSSFITTILSNYLSQELEYKTTKEDYSIGPSFCYTYNEKLSIHQNAQKELTFSMDRMLMQHEEWFVNPYISALHVGSLLELQDKYDNHFLFIIKKIAFTFKEHNITYNYTCQDAFSYQYTRQQSGYTITNDSSSEDFIGPKTVDWWVVNKIKPECYIEYSYIPVNQGLYYTIESNVYHFYTFNNRDDLDNIDKVIVKEPFISTTINEGGEEYDELQTTIIFSCSNSNANAALIALGDQLDLMLHTFELPVGQTYVKYFWFEPKKNQETTGLRYSPSSNISNLGLDFSGDSLTTILNVNSNEVGDDLVTLLPSTPSFFLSKFIDPDWEKTSYSYGYFTHMMSDVVFTNTSDNNTLQTENSVSLGELIGIRIFETTDKKLTIPVGYNHFKANSDNSVTSFTIQYINSSETSTFLSTNNTIYLYIVYNNQTYLIASDEEIPTTLIGVPLECYLAIHGSNFNIINPEIYLSFYRLFTAEEKEFASVADACPWLENRLIDFSYFLHQNIITRQEYSYLMDTLQNKLRIINGKLLYYTDAYYAALKQKVSIVSNITNQLDALSAAFEADVVVPIKNNGEVSDISSFISAYASTLKISSEQKTPILNYSSLINEYFEKYFNAEQRFLKNMYSFRQYFEDVCSFSYDSNACIYEDTLSTSVNLAQPYFLSFGRPTFVQWDGDTSGQIMRYKNSHYYDAYLVTSSNFTNFYKPEYTTDSFIQIKNINADSSFNYDVNTNNDYYLTKKDYEKFFAETVRRTFKDDDVLVRDNTIYYKLNITELKRLILYSQYLKNNQKASYYIRNTNIYTPLDDVRLDVDKIASVISWTVLPNLLDYLDIDQAVINNDYKDISTWNDFHKNYYRAFFPLSTIYYYGPSISYKIGTGIDEETKQQYQTYSYYRYTKNGQTDADLLKIYSTIEAIPDNLNPINYNKYQEVSFIGNGSLLQDWGICSNTDATAKKQKLSDAWQYYSLNYAPKGASIAHEIVVGLFNPMYAILSTTLNTFLNENWCQWKKNSNAFRSFEGSLAAHDVNAADSRGDSVRANYSLTETGGEDYLKEMALWYRARGGASAEWGDTVPPAIQNYTLDDTIHYEIDDAIKDTKIKYRAHQYFNFYKYLAATYRFRLGVDGNNLYCKNKYLRRLTATSCLNKKDTYVRIPIVERTDGSDETDIDVKVSLAERKKWKYITNYSELDEYFSSIAWYPLYNLSKDLDLNSLDITWDSDNTIKLGCGLADESNTFIKQLQSSLTENQTLTATEDGIITFTDSDNSIYCKYMYCRVEEYDRQEIVGNTITENLQYNVKSTTDTLGTIYSLATDLPVNILELSKALQPYTSENQSITDPLNNILIHFTSDDTMIPIENSDNINTTFCYRYDGINYERVYTQQQIKDAQSKDTLYCTTAAAKEFYILSNTSTTIVNFNNSTMEFSPVWYLCSIIQTNDIYTITAKQYIGKDNSISFTGTKGQTAINQTKTLIVDGITYTSTIGLTGKVIQSLVNLTNGEFWYRFHEKIEWPTIFEMAASIETQLQTYWDQAYTASKYCKYFLPESWQPNTSTVKNGFSSKIILAQYNAENELVGVALSDYFVPYINIYTNDKYVTSTDYKHYLKKYTWYWNETNTDTIDIFNSNNKVLETENYIKPSEIECLNNNKGVIDILNFLGTDIDNWTVVENGYTVYYYQVGGGVLWSDLVNELGISSNFNLLTGLYGMMFYILTNAYTNRDMSVYTSLQKEKRAIWETIYNDYPFIMLEDNYSYSLATNSTELLKMAQLIFKGKKEPERNYSISLIDLNSLQGYIGQELTPGQGIAINAEEYYDENADIKNALQQFLFISDVNYTLRDDSNISITVNNIKYQEKLLQSLVKLIR